MITGKNVCGLCGEEVKHTKGEPKKAYEYELRTGAHIRCQKIHKEILEKHRLSPNEYAGAIITGMLELFPEIRETKSVKDYDERKKKAEEEIGNAFTYLKERDEEKKKVDEEKKEITNDRI